MSRNQRMKSESRVVSDLRGVMPGAGKRKRLREYQKEVIRGVEAFGGRALIASRMGSGKTLMTVRWLYRHPECFPALIVCPAQCKPGWAETIRLELLTQPQVIQGRPRASSDGNFADIVIVNWDVLANWLDLFQQWKPATVIYDECQYCANVGRKRTSAAVKLGMRAPYAIALSGSPLMKRPIELYPTLYMLAPHEFGDFRQYAEQYCGPTICRFSGRTLYKGATHVEELHQRLRKSVMLRPQNIELELPEKTRIIEPMPINLKLYQEHERKFTQWIDGDDEASELEQLGAFSKLRKLSAKLKIPSILEWLRLWYENAEPDEKLVVFGHHRDVLEALTKVKIKSVLVYGGIGAKDRSERLTAFRNRPDMRICFASMRAIGTGLDGLQVANTMAFCELDPNPMIHAQAEARIHRMGQERQTSIYYLIAAGTLEEKLAELIQSRQQMISVVLDGAPPSAEDELDIFTELRKSLLSR